MTAATEQQGLGETRVFNPPADFTANAANYLDQTQWSCINPDLSIHVVREPVEYTGFKLCVGTLSLHGHDIQALYALTQAPAAPVAATGLVRSEDVVARYVDDVVARTGRLARRLGWTEESDPVKVEHAIGALFLKRDWTMLSHHLIWHGRRVCHARNPACGACPVARWCPAYGEGPTDPEVAATLVRTEGRA